MRTRVVGWVTVVVLTSLAVNGVVAWSSSVRPDEEVVLFDSLATLSPDGLTWSVPIRGWVFEPERDSILRRLALKALAKSLGLASGSEDETVFNARAGLFLVDNQGHKKVEIQVGDRVHTLSQTGPNGHTVGSIRIPVRSKGDVAPPWLRYGVVLPVSDTRRFEGMTQLVGPRGVSVISDIDDTIKISNVLDKKELLANTFLRPFRPVGEMAQAYSRWANAGAVFHYVSASPWQLYPSLRSFLDEHGFPLGALQLKLFRIKDGSFLGLFDSPEQYKIPSIEEILSRYPQRTFLLVGDSGEKDPEIYGEIARKHPAQVKHIFIRNVAPGTGDAARFEAAFKDVRKERCTVFTDPKILLAYDPR